MTLNV